jgi:hypothetical protein
MKDILIVIQSALDEHGYEIPKEVVPLWAPWKLTKNGAELIVEKSGLKFKITVKEEDDYKGDDSVGIIPTPIPA